MPGLKLISAVEGADKVKLDDLLPFQGDLKRLERNEYERLRNSLIKNDISFTVHVWRHKGKKYIIDGHQRVWTMKQMRDVEGYEIPLISVSYVKAKTFADAKRKILAGVSQFGRVTVKSLHDFLKENDIPFDEVVATYNFPEVDMSVLTSMFEEINANIMDGVEALGTEEFSDDLKHAGDGVKQVQLFFDSVTHNEFIQKTADLSVKYSKDNLTDTIMEVVREAHKSCTKKHRGLVQEISG